MKLDNEDKLIGVKMDLTQLQEKINESLYPSDHIFKYIHHFSFKLEQTHQNNWGAHVKTANGDFSYQEFWRNISSAITTVTFGDKYNAKIEDLMKEENISQNTASNQIFTSALSHFQTKNNQGKMGEVLLFFMLENLFNAVRLGSKFHLSMPTNQQMGNDATHIGIIGENGTKYPCFYIGEAKFYQDFSQAIQEALKSLAAHRPTDKLTEELKWLRTTEAMHDMFKDVIGELGTYDYKVRQVAFIIYKDENTLPEEKKIQIEIQEHLEAEIQELLSKELQKQKYQNTLANNTELHFVVFSLKDYQQAHEAFQETFSVELTTLKG